MIAGHYTFLFGKYLIPESLQLTRMHAHIQEMIVYLKIFLLHEYYPTYRGKVW